MLAYSSIFLNMYMARSHHEQKWCLEEAFLRIDSEESPTLFKLLRQFLHLSGIIDHCIRDLGTAKDPRQFFHRLLFIKQPDSCLGAAIHRPFFNTVVAVCHGCKLCQMGDTDDLPASSDQRQLL